LSINNPELLFREYIMSDIVNKLEKFLCEAEASKITWSDDDIIVALSEGLGVPLSKKLSHLNERGMQTAVDVEGIKKQITSRDVKNVALYIDRTNVSVDMIGPQVKPTDSGIKFISGKAVIEVTNSDMEHLQINTKDSVALIVGNQVASVVIEFNSSFISNLVNLFKK
jgi:hypothetical protein